jgi:hypothetical protein
MAHKQSEMTAILDANRENRRLYEQAFGMKPELLFKRLSGYVLDTPSSTSGNLASESLRRSFGNVLNG